MFKIGDNVKLNEIGSALVECMFENDKNKHKGKIVEIMEDELGVTSYLIQFPKGFKGHGGNGLSKKVYKDKNVLWLTSYCFELDEQPNEDTNNDEDEPMSLADFLNSFLDALDDKPKEEHKPKEKFKPYIESIIFGEKSFRGYIGDETKMVDCNNTKLYIGDIVSVGNEYGKTNTYVGVDNNKKPIIMGIAISCHEDGAIDSMFKVNKLIDHSIAHNYLDMIEIPFNVKYILKESDIND